MLEFYIKSSDAKTHIQLCEIISLTGIEIIEDFFGDISIDGYYGMFHVKGSEDSFELLTDFPGIDIELPPDKIIR